MKKCLILRIPTIKVNNLKCYQIIEIILIAIKPKRYINVAEKARKNSFQMPLNLQH